MALGAMKLALTIAAAAAFSCLPAPLAAQPIDPNYDRALAQHGTMFAGHMNTVMQQAREAFSQASLAARVCDKERLEQQRRQLARLKATMEAEQSSWLPPYHNDFDPNLWGYVHNYLTYAVEQTAAWMKLNCAFPNVSLGQEPSTNGQPPIADDIAWWDRLNHEEWFETAERLRLRGDCAAWRARLEAIERELRRALHNPTGPVDELEARVARWQRLWRYLMVDVRSRPCPPSAALDRAPPPSKPQTAPQRPPQDRTSVPTRPGYAPLSFPTVPRAFCSEEERRRFLIEMLNPQYLKAAENAERAARLRSEVARAVNAYVQAGRPVPAELRGRQRQANADYAEQQRLSDEIAKLREQVLRTPIIDCSRTTPGQPATSPDELRLRSRLRDQIGRAATESRDARSRCDPAAMAAAIAELERLVREARDRVGGLQIQDERYLDDQQAAELSEAETDLKAAEQKLARARARQRDCPRTMVQQSAVPLLDPTAATILNVHNQARAEAGVAPLHWNAELAAGAAAYGATLSQLGSLQHAPREGRRTVRENLLQAPRGQMSPAQMVQRWTAEKRYFRPGIYPNVCSMGWQACAHYTQMVWPTTTDLGCAVYSDRRYDWLVCRYSPPGNRDGTMIGASPERGR